MSIIIVTFNAPDRLRACLASITGAAAPGVPHEIIALDNASTPTLVPLLAEYLPSSQIVDVGANIGFARASNLGASRARGRYLLFLNPDAVATTGAVEEMVRIADSEHDVGVLGARTVNEQGGVDGRCCFGEPTSWSLFCFATGFSAAFRRSRWFDTESLGPWNRDSARDVPNVAGCAMLVRRSLWDQLGGFDPGFFMYGEDADLCARTRAAGHHVRFDPGPTFMHVWGGSSASSGAKTTLMLAGRVAYLRKHGHALLRRIGPLLLRSGVAMRALVARARRRPDNGWAVAWSRRREWVNGFDRHPFSVAPVIAMDPVETIRARGTG